MSYSNPNIIASGTTFAQFQAAGASGHLERLITANMSGTNNPTSAGTLSSNAGGTSGGLLPAGAYYANFTETNGYGESTASAESGPITLTSQAAPTGTPTVSVTGSGGTLTDGVYYGKITYVDTSLNASGVHGETTAGNEFTFTQTSTDEPVVTFNDGGLPAWASGRNLYLTAAGGASGSEVLAFTGITATTYTITANPSASTTTPPAANTTTTQIPKFTAFPALQTNNVARNIYLTPTGGASGSEVLYAREQTGATFTFSAALPNAGYSVPIPTVNTTAFDEKDYELLRGAKANNLDRLYLRLRELVVNWNRGNPDVDETLILRLKECHLAFAMFAQLCSEMGVLIDANPGHLNVHQNTGIGFMDLKRVWP